MEDHTPHRPESIPILDTGATHRLLPITWLGAEECEKAKRIHLKVATGTAVRALLYNNVVYAKSVTRPLISVGQLKGMLDLRMIWDDSSPLIVVCYAGKNYVLLQANVVHHLPLVSKKELRAILSAIFATLLSRESCGTSTNGMQLGTRPWVSSFGLIQIGHLQG